MPAVSLLLCWWGGFKSHLISWTHLNKNNPAATDTPLSLSNCHHNHACGNYYDDWSTEIPLTLVSTEQNIGSDVTVTMWQLTYRQTIQCLWFFFCKSIHVASHVKRTLISHHHMKEGNTSWRRHIPGSMYQKKMAWEETWRMNIHLPFTGAVCPTDGCTSGQSRCSPWTE